MAVQIRRINALLCLCVAISGCSSPPRNHSVPEGAQDRAIVVGMTPAVRTWGSAVNPDFMAALVNTVEWERASRPAEAESGRLAQADLLAISGGGQNGAFGAGLLCAWSELEGGRPAFKAVTGISTGALTAPFVFAGPAYDHVLREVYTQTKTDDILTSRGMLAAIFDDAMADTKPLWSLLSKYVNDELLAAIAAEYHKGRLLLIGTTNLDARRAVIWNIGEIAASGDPRAGELVRKILMASAAIPGAFPPVMIDAEVDGQVYQEMHVDGGATTQVFLYPPSLRVRAEAEAAGVVRDRRLYVIRNSRFAPEYSEVKRRTMSIAMRAIDSMINTQGIGDLYRIYLNCQRDGIDFNLAFIPPTFTEKAADVFDPEYMTKLFHVGYNMMKEGQAWEKTPPGFAGTAAALGAGTG